MNGAAAWLLGLDRLRFGQPNVEFGFAHPLPEWGWALVVLAAVGVAWWSYRRLLGPAWWRAVLGGMRALVLILLAVLIAGPRLIKPNETRERDWVIVLVDRSASMGVRDVAGADARGNLRTRDEQLRAALEASSPLWRELAKERVVLWMGFDAQAFEMAGVGSPAGEPLAADAEPVKLTGADGRRTALGRALEQALKRAAARPVAGVVVISDGRSADEVGRGVVRRLDSEKIPVFVVPIGSDRPLADVAVRSAEAPASAFVNDIVPVQIELERVGPAEGRRPVKVELVDKLSGEVLDQRRVEPPANSAPAPDGPVPANPGADALKDEESVKQAITLTAKPVRAGATNWTVRITPEGDDLTGENNQSDLELTLEDRPLRAVYFDGAPRWEFRYLKNLLIREKSIVSSNLVLSPGRSYVQEGDEALEAMPTTSTQWRAFDVVILGDVSPDVFTPEQLLQLRDLIASRGAGLIWIGGEGATPGAWAGTPLADLIPFGSSGGDAGGIGGSGDGLVRAWDGEVIVRPTDAAARYGVLRLRATPDEEAPAGSAMSWWPSALADPNANWSRLRWAQHIERSSLKPSAEVLAESYVVDGPDAERSGPLVVTMRYGAGRVLYVATDEIWRWRYGRGEDLPEKFWLPLVRLLGRDSLARSGAAARLSVSPARAPVDAPVRIVVDLIDQRLIDQAPPTVTVRVTPLDAGDGIAVSAGEVVLTPEDGGSGGIGAGSRRYSGLWAPSRAGRFRAIAADALLSDQKLTADIEVWMQDDELRRPQADHAKLAQLAAATEGKVVPPDELGGLGPQLPNRRLVIVGAPEEETLWDSPLALMLFLGLMTLEWVGRRLIRFV